MNDTELIYIGSDFYHDSGTRMSCIYSVDGRRYDWGFVERDLREGLAVTIRPANAIELDYYRRKLTSLKRHREESK